MTKSEEYAVLIAGKIAELFDDSEGDAMISEQEFEVDNDNTTAFIHAMANLVPTLWYNKITGENKNQLHFNHIANQLCFQFSTKSDKDK